jgi:hypothetical protein
VAGDAGQQTHQQQRVAAVRGRSLAWASYW